MLIKIVTYNNEQFITRIDSYDPTALAETINNSIGVVPLGDLIVNKNSINIVVPLEDEDSIESANNDVE